MIPIKLVINNFLSHKHSEIDFNNFNVALIVGMYDDNPDQSNGAGKSAIFEAIMWALFDKSRHKKKDGVVKRDAKKCYVEFTFGIDSEIYKIIRKRDKVVGESEILFEQFVDGKFKSITCDNDTATNKKIIDTIGVNSDVFINSVYFKQNDISIFAESKPSERKDTLKALLKMDMWDQYQKRSRDIANSIKGKIEANESLVIPIEKIQEEIEKSNESIVDLKNKLSLISTHVDKVSSELMSKKAYFDSVYKNSGSLDDLKKLQREYASAKRRIKDIYTIKQNNDNVIQKNISLAASLKQQLIKLDGMIKSAATINILDTRKRLLAGKTKDKVLADEISRLTSDIVLGNDCNACKKPLSARDKDEIQKIRKKELDEARLRYNDLRDKLQKYEKIAKDNEDKVARANSAEIEKGKVALKLAKIQSEIDRAAPENEQLDKELLLINSRNFDDDINKLKLKFNKEECEKLEAEILKLDSMLSEGSRKRDKLNIELGSFMSKKKELQVKEQEQANIQLELNKLVGEFSVYDKLRHYFGKEGVQAIIIENVIDELENYANDTLSKICNEPTTLKIQTQKETDKGSWTETFDIEVVSGGRSDEFETFSGGEKFRISFALRLALSKILSKRMGGTLQFLLLDEVSSSLDDKGLEMFISIVKQLGDEMKIMVITHDEKLKEMFDDLIVVNKGFDGSSIELTN